MAQDDNKDVRIVSEESIEKDIKRQGIAHARLAIVLSIGVIAVSGLAGLGVLVASFYWRIEPPQWATATVTATTTAAIALLIKDHLPSTK